MKTISNNCFIYVSAIYMVFVFKKLKGTLDLNGKTVYNTDPSSKNKGGD